MRGADCNTLDSWLAGHACHQPHHPALITPEGRWTYSALHARVQRLAAVLEGGLELKRGDRIALLGHNSAAQVALLFAAARLGVIVVPLNWRLAAEELAYATRHCGARVVFYGSECAAHLPAIAEGSGVRAVNTGEELAALEARSPEQHEEAHAPAPCSAARLGDPFLIVYTSGTTGRPKGAVHTQESVLWNALISLHAQELTGADHVLNVLPLFHVGGINIQMMPCFFAGGTVSLHPGFDPERVLYALNAEGITTTVCVPTMMRALLDMPQWESAHFPALRLINTGSTDVPVDILTAVNQRGIPMVQVYGATETGPITTYQRPGEAAQTIGSIGRCGAHTRIRLVDEAGEQVAPGEAGEIEVNGPNNFLEYWRDPEATRAALHDGWFRTGDVARQDEAGLLWFVGRRKHVIISGGENIYPAEVERLFAQVPGLDEACVVGRPDARWGEVPVLLAVCRPDGPSREALLGLPKGRIARFKHPKDVVFVEKLPRNALGKVCLTSARALVAPTGESQLQ